MCRNVNLRIREDGPTADVRSDTTLHPVCYDIAMKGQVAARATLNGLRNRGTVALNTGRQLASRTSTRTGPTRDLALARGWSHTRTGYHGVSGP